MDTLFLLKGYLLFLLGLSGACAGSFLLCLCGRSASGESVMKGRSRCDACGHTLGVVDLIPVFSYLFLRGKCRFCGEKIAPSCVIAELVSAFALVSVGLKCGYTLETIEGALFAVSLLWVSLMDLKTMMIPGGALLLAAGARLSFLFYSGGWKPILYSFGNSLAIVLPLFLFVLLFERVRKKEAMGGGDLKLLFVTGLYFTWKCNLLLLVLSCVFGIVGGIWANRKKEGDGAFPFGPAIGLAAWTVFLFGESVLNWYAGLF